MRNYYFLASLLMATSFSALADNAWVTVASADAEEWQAKSTSFELITGVDKKPAASVIGRVVNKKDSSIQLHRWQVPLKDCDAMVGSLRILSLKGELLFDSDFVEGGGTVASAIAETICLVAERNAQRSGS